MRNAVLFIFVFAAFVFAVGGGGSGTTTTIPTTTIAPTTTDSTTTTLHSDFVFNGKVLPCGTQETMRERVRCRIHAPYEDDEGLYYVPEECRALASESRHACFALYDNVQLCRFLEDTGERMRCVRTKLALREGVRFEVQTCRSLPASERGQCVATVRSNAFALAKFRLYDLEHKAEELGEAGVISSARVEDFVLALEQKKLEFNEASTIQGKIDVLKNARVLWLELKAEALASLGDSQ